MPESVLKEINSLSIWDISHYWHGYSPQETSASRLPVVVEQTMRALAKKASGELYFRCVNDGIVYKALTDPYDDIAVSYVKRYFKRELGFVIDGRKYKRNFLNTINMGRKGILIWCKKNRIDPPKFWFDDSDPLLSKTIEELNTGLSPEKMKEYGYIPMFEYKNDVGSFPLSQDSATFSEAEGGLARSSIIRDAISRMNQKNAKARYSKLDQLKEQFQIYYESNSSNYPSKAELIRHFFDSLSPNEKIAIVPTFDEKSPKENYRKAIRNLSEVVEK